AKVLSNQLDIPHISTGDIFREAKASGSEMGKKLAEYMNQGLLVPDELVNEIVTQRLVQDDIKEKGFILDGYPRTKNQAQVFDTELDRLGIKLDMVIYMKTSKEVIVKRLTGRRLCSSCGKIYHVTNIPPRTEGKCDICAKDLYQRDDDKEETVLKRLEVYNKQTKELIDYYSERGVLKTVSGDMDVRQLYDVLSEVFANEGLL
ncbi:MAG: nucleoside monophosphate kinase, partial [Candidatus Omnitrophota bacterium]